MRFNKVKAKTALLVTGKTQCEIAESLELSRRWVNAALNGEKTISEKVARRIAAALGVSVDDLKED
ncbi:MAG: helix-turn-helix transcriptional regulator [Faecalibacterium sp.]